MEGKKVGLVFKVRVKVEERDKCFAAITSPFAITAYGKTAEDAEHRALKAITMMLRRHESTEENMLKFLKSRRVKVMNIERKKEKARPVSECRREIPILAGARANG